MKKHHERRLIPFSVVQLYEIVSDVNKYDEFVPWCHESKVLTKTSTNMSAQIGVGFGFIKEQYISNVSMIYPEYISAVAKDTGLFDHLLTEWRFSAASDPKHTWVTFHVEFKFKSQIYNQVSEIFLKEVVSVMVKAFEKRCRQIYLPSAVSHT
eukprot:gene13855-18581_t